MKKNRVVFRLLKNESCFKNIRYLPPGFLKVNYNGALWILFWIKKPYIFPL